MELKLYAISPIKDITIGGKTYRKGNIAGGVQANTLEEAKNNLKKDTFILQQFIREYTFGNVSEYGKTAEVVYSKDFTIVEDHVFWGSLGAQLVKPKNTNAVGYGTFNIYTNNLKTVALKNSNFESAGGTLTTSQWFKSRFFTTGLVVNLFNTAGKVTEIFYLVENATKDVKGWVNKKDVELVKSWGDLLADTTSVTIQQPLQKVRETVETIQEAGQSIVSGVKLAGIGFILFSLLKDK